MESNPLVIEMNYNEKENKIVMSESDVQQPEYVKKTVITKKMDPAENSDYTYYYYDSGSNDVDCFEEVHTTTEQIENCNSAGGLTAAYIEVMPRNNQPVTDHKQHEDMQGYTDSTLQYDDPNYDTEVSLQIDEQCYEEQPVKKKRHKKEVSSSEEEQTEVAVKVEIEEIDEEGVILDCFAEELNETEIKQEHFEDEYFKIFGTEFCLPPENLESTEEYKCEFCNFISYDKNAFKNHIVRKHSEFNPSYTCPHCPYRSRKSSMDLLKKHIITKHTEKPVYYCEFCQNKYYKKKHLYDHLKEIHPNNKMYACDFCNYQSIKRYDIVNHVKERHTGEKNFCCPHCPYKSARKSDLKIHVTGMHINAKPFGCPHCNYRSSRKGDLRCHIMGTHSTEKPYTCPHCNYRSARKGDLQTHITGRHNAGKKFTCPLCSYASSWKGDLQFHIKKRHPNRDHLAPLQIVHKDEMSHNSMSAQ